MHTITIENTDKPALRADHVEFAPRLRMLSAPHDFFPRSWISWTRITELHLGFRFDSMVHCINLMRQSPYLVTASVAYRWDGEPTPATCPTAQFQHLRTLFVHSTVLTEESDSIFEYLELPTPSLQELRYDGYMWGMPLFRHVLERSFCSLQKLILNLTHNEEEYIIEECQAFNAEEVPAAVPEVEEFAFSWMNSYNFPEVDDDDWDPCYLDDKVLHRLTAARMKNNKVLLPSLRSIDLSLVGHENVDCRKLVDMIHSRWQIADSPESNSWRRNDYPVVTLLRTVTLRLDGHPDHYAGEDDKYASDLLRKLQVEGLKVILIDHAGCIRQW